MGELLSFVSKNDLETEIESLRVTVSMLILELDHLCYVLCRNIETEYFLMFGGLESQVYQSEMKMRRLKRKLELLIAARNRQVKVSDNEIEQQLDAEFLMYQDELEALFHKINTSLDRHNNGVVLSDKDSKKIKTVYRQIMKQLHPDLNPTLSEEEQQLFFRAVEAYEQGILWELELIADVMDKTQRVVPIDGLHEERNRLMYHVEQLNQKIMDVKGHYPYLFIEILEHEQKRNEHRQHLQDQLAYYQEGIQYYEAELSNYRDCFKAVVQNNKYYCI